MDYSKVKYVKPSVDGLDITKGKVYKVIRYNKTLIIHGILDDVGNYTSINIEIGTGGCRHLNGSHWIPCDENGKELSND